MITIRKSPKADTRTCDVSQVSKEVLLASSLQHIGDVGKALGFFCTKLIDLAVWHDYDKLTDIDSFYADFKTKFEQHAWWDRHRMLCRHHLTAEDGIPEDVNLFDVLEYIADCVMAGLARSGSVYELKLDPPLLEKAFQNTVKLLKSEIVLSEEL